MDNSSGILTIIRHIGINSASPPDVHEVHVQNNEVDLSNLRLEEIPKETLQFANVKKLILLHNWIKGISPTLVSGLPHLEVLEIDDNYVQSFPKNIGDWTNLTRISAKKNDLKSLPLSFYKLGNLVYLNLEKNPLDPDFSKIYDPDWTEHDCFHAARRSVCLMRESKQILIANFPNEAFEILHKRGPITEPDYSLPSGIGLQSPESQNSLHHINRMELFYEQNNPFDNLEQEIFRVEMYKKEMLRNKDKPKLGILLPNFGLTWRGPIIMLLTYSIQFIFFVIGLTFIFANFLGYDSIEKYVGNEYREVVIIKPILSFYKWLQDQMIKSNYPCYFQSEIKAQNTDWWTGIKNLYNAPVFTYIYKPENGKR